MNSNLESERLNKCEFNKNSIYLRNRYKYLIIYLFNFREIELHKKALNEINTRKNKWLPKEDYYRIGGTHNSTKDLYHSFDIRMYLYNLIMT